MKSPKMIMNYLLAMMFLFFSIACKKETSFKGTAKKETPAENAIAEVKPTPAPEPTPTTEPTPAPALPEPPKNAVTKGSFTVYTDPVDPAPDQDYKIVVLITLPSNVDKYYVEDLSGKIVGTDHYEQDIRENYVPYNGFFSANGGKNQVKGELPVTNGVAKHEVMVPGANIKVKDTIDVRSEILNEEQSIEIIF